MQKKDGKEKLKFEEEWIFFVGVCLGETVFLKPLAESFSSGELYSHNV